MHKTHGMSSTRLYAIWVEMRRRCRDERFTGYYKYGGRGITVCPEWDNDFVAFYEWAMSHGYRDDLTIDRIDNNRGYSPENCRWVDYTEQNNNTRRNRLFTIGNRTQTLAQWCRECEVCYKTVWTRLSIGWDIVRALTTPPGRQGRSSYGR